MIARSHKTTLAGLAAALGILGYALESILADGWQVSDIGLVLTALGAAVFGFVARDDDVSSEGLRIKKIRD